MKPLRIMIIEDDGMISLLLTILLEDMGFEVCATEETEDDAVRAAEKACPDLVIADVNLKQGSGLGAMERIGRHRLTPHIFATANVAAIRAARPDAVMIQKPYQVHQLQEAIDMAMGSGVLP